MVTDRFRIVERLGGGGMGEVYRAEDLELDVSVALKFLHGDRARDTEWLQRLRNEVRTARRVAHPHVCRVYDITEFQGEHFISMEYIDGEDLSSLLRRIGHLPPAKAMQIARHLCAGLGAIHDQGVLHRDLKPANVMIDGVGDVRIMDFGIAALAGHSGVAKGRVGTPAYMAPEQVAGGDVSPATDIHALGLVILEVYAGAAGPGTAASGSGDSGDFDLAPDRLRNLDPGIRRLVNHCLEADPADRPQSAAAVAEALASADAESGDLRGDRESGAAALHAPSIAVLPFADMSAEKDQGYFCEGMAEEIINSLSRLEGVHVVSRSSSFQFAGASEDIRRIARQLNVETVLEGSVRKSGRRLRVTAQLVSAADGYHLWSERFDRELEDVFAIQDEISEAIVEKLKGRLAADQYARSVKRYTDNVEAYELYLKGRFVETARTRTGIEHGIEYFERAKEADPSYALAHAGIADSHSLLAWYRFLTPHDAFPRARAAAETALEIDDALPEAHTALGVVRFYYDWDWAGAERSFSRAIAINPQDTWALHSYAESLAAADRLDEALSTIKLAHQIDPLSMTINACMGWVLYFSRQYDEAIGHYERTLEMDPEYAFLHWFLAQAYLMQGMSEQAIESLQLGLSRTGDHPGMMAYLGFAYGRSGRRSDALDLLRTLGETAQREYVPSDYFAVLALGLDRRDVAIECLQKAAQERALHLVYLGVDPLFDPLRGEDGFEEVVRLIGPGKS